MAGVYDGSHCARRHCWGQQLRPCRNRAYFRGRHKPVLDLLMPPLDLREWGCVSGGGISAPPVPAPPDPSTISGLIAWFDPTQNLTVSGSDVDSWASSYGPGNTVSNTGSTRPTYLASGLLSKPCVSFSRSASECLTGASTLAAAIDNRAPFTAIAVVQFASTSTSQAMFGAGNNVISDRSGVFSIVTAPNYRITFASGGGTTGFTSTAVPSTSPAICAFVYDGTNFSFRLNGSVFSGATSTRTPTCNVFSIGCQVLSGVAQTFFDGLIGDVTVYDSALSAANCEIVEAYFRYKYPGLP